jgi:hypothetical protein
MLPRWQRRSFFTLLAEGFHRVGDARSHRVRRGLAQPNGPQQGQQMLVG